MVRRLLLCWLMMRKEVNHHKSRKRGRDGILSFSVWNDVTGIHSLPLLEAQHSRHHSMHIRMETSRSKQQYVFDRPCIIPLLWN